MRFSSTPQVLFAAILFLRGSYSETRHSLATAHFGQGSSTNKRSIHHCSAQRTVGTVLYKSRVPPLHSAIKVISILKYGVAAGRGRGGHRNAYPSSRSVWPKQGRQVFADVALWRILTTYLRHSACSRLVVYQTSCCRSLLSSKYVI